MRENSEDEAAVTVVFPARSFITAMKSALDLQVELVKESEEHADFISVLKAYDNGYAQH